MTIMRLYRFWLHRFVMRLVVVTPIATALTCATPDPRVQCPDALKRGFKGDGMTPCHNAATADRAIEFKAQHRLTGSCPRDSHIVECSGVTFAGVPVRFRCDGHGCQFIPSWAW